MFQGLKYDDICALLHRTKVTKLSIPGARKYEHDRLQIQEQAVHTHWRVGKNAINIHNHIFGNGKHMGNHRLNTPFRILLDLGR